MERFVRYVFIGKAKRDLLSRYGWYRNINGGYTHPHAMDYMTSLEIKKCSNKELEYKLQHGSQASFLIGNIK